MPPDIEELLSLIFEMNQCSIINAQITLPLTKSYNHLPDSNLVAKKFNSG